jgi:hypothetical protein
VFNDNCPAIFDRATFCAPNEYHSREQPRCAQSTPSNSPDIKFYRFSYHFAFIVK